MTGRIRQATLVLLLVLGSAAHVAAQSADLSVTKVDSPDPLAPGNNLTYTITVTNNGPDAAANVSLTDTIPANTTFVSFTSPGGWSSTTPPVGGTGTVTATNPSVASGTTAVFTLVVNVNAGTASGTIVTNTASVTSATVDPNPANNSSTATTTVVAPQADLSVTKADSPDPVAPGNNLTYTITVTNNGPDAAANVSLTDAVPANTTFVSFTSPGGWTSTTPPVGGTGTVTATNPSVASGATAVFTLVVNVNPGTASGTIIGNTASVTSATADPSPANNSSTATTTVQQLIADLVVTLTDAPDPVAAGANLTYTITLTNAGPDPATNVSLSSSVPLNTTFVSFAGPPGWTIASTVATRPLLAVGTPQVFTLVVAVNPATPGGTELTNFVTTLSPTTSDPAVGSNADFETTAVATAVPALGPMQLIVLAALLLMLAVWRLRARASGGPGRTA